MDTAREELLEVVACLRDARRYSRLNAKTPSGVLLCGPPGTGKTLLGEPHSSLCQPCLMNKNGKTLLPNKGLHMSVQVTCHNPVFIPSGVLGGSVRPSGVNRN